MIILAIFFYTARAKMRNDRSKISLKTYYFHLNDSIPNHFILEHMNHKNVKCFSNNIFFSLVLSIENTSINLNITNQKN